MTQVIKMEHIRKIYDNGFLASDNINFSLNEGEIHAIAGENGAGKSTLMKMLYGVETPTSGKIFVHGQETKISSPAQSMKLGIGMVFQHFMLVDELTVFENIFLGVEETKFNYLLKQKMRKELDECAAKFNIHIDYDKKCGDLSVSQKQKVEILKVLSKMAKILIFDEPTAVLTAPEVDELFAQLKLLKEAGHTIVIITHKLQEIKALCDRVSVLRKGKYLGTYDVDKVTTEEISRLMVGFDVDFSRDDVKAEISEKVLLEVKSLGLADEGNEVKRVSFSVHSGEIVCLTGVEGSGQEKVIDFISGNIRPTVGEIYLNNKLINKNNIKSRRMAGLSHIPADRMVLGANLDNSILENMSAHRINAITLKTLGFYNKRKLKSIGLKEKKEYRISTPDLEQSINLLSGGNIQKIVTAREIETNPLVLIAEHPTRGVDVGTMEFIFHKMRELKSKGRAILLVSTDWNEMMALADRIIIFYNDEIVATINDPQAIDEYELGYYMLGLKKMEQLS